MRGTVVMFCLIGAVFANPIFFSAISESNSLDSNSTESLSVSQSSENDTSELQSSEESNSIQSQSSESESSESTSEDKTSEESNSQSDEDVAIDLMIETRDDSMGSEENIRKSWVQQFASVIKDLSAEENSSMEVKAQPDHLTEKQPTLTSTSTNNTESSSESTSSESTSSESDQTNETSEESDSSSEESKSLEDSNAIDSDELQQIKAPDCVKGTQSCESEEYFFQDIGDDAQYSVDNLMMPEEAERELRLRR
ncbi:secretory calcium-binding phosphoprotein 1 [Notothenia coriiceps]|uniref:Secretory calcium-binding phosphoprotein 1 n=1 Tax=Notothenia coriiceps TaxID=8208 RepID=A0A6I9MT54_9TELE|nr:PREDICTED: lisH domain-containing protein C1711.05-like [Notothenia coriiceps]